MANREAKPISAQVNAMAMINFTPHAQFDFGTFKLASR
jgi:hypothetical protein